MKARAVVLEHKSRDESISGIPMGPVSSMVMENTTQVLWGWDRAQWEGMNTLHFPKLISLYVVLMPLE